MFFRCRGFSESNDTLKKTRGVTAQEDCISVSTAFPEAVSATMMDDKSDHSYCRVHAAVTSTPDNVKFSDSNDTLKKTQGETTQDKARGASCVKLPAIVTNTSRSMFR